MVRHARREEATIYRTRRNVVDFFFVFETEAINPDHRAVTSEGGKTSKSYGKTVLMEEPE